MTLGEFRILTAEAKDGDEILIFPDKQEGRDEDGKLITVGPGLALWAKDLGQLLYIDDAQLVDTSDNTDEEE